MLTTSKLVPDHIAGFAVTYGSVLDPYTLYGGYILLTVTGDISLVLAFGEVGPGNNLGLLDMVLLHYRKYIIPNKEPARVCGPRSGKIDICLYLCATIGQSDRA